MPTDQDRSTDRLTADDTEIVIALPANEAADDGVVMAELVEEGTKRNWLRIIAVGLAAAAVGGAIAGLTVTGAASAGWSGLSSQVSTAADGVAELWDTWTGRLQAIAAAEPAPQLEPGADPESASLLVVVTDDGGAAASVALFSSAPDGDHSVVLFPATLLATIPGYGDFPLGETVRFEDAELLALTVSNLLGVRVDSVVRFDSGDLAATLGEPVPVDLPLPVVIGDDGGGSLLADAGVSALEPSLLEIVLTIPGEASQLEWLERQGAIWDGVLEAVRTKPELVPGFVVNASPITQAEAAITAAASAVDRSVSLVPLTSLSVGDAERFSLPRDEAEAFVVARLDHLLLREGARPRVEVLNGNGRIQATRLVAEALVRRGFEVIKTDNADSFDYSESRVISQGRDNRLAGVEVVELLGVGRLELELRRPSGVVDISIIVGHDIPTGEG